MRLKKMSRQLAILIAVNVFFPFAAEAAIYTFIDENGSLHITNVPQDPRYRPGLKKRPTADWGAIDHYKYDDHIRRAARMYEVDPLLVKAVIKAESNFDSWALSKKGAIGLMQLMPATADDLSVSDPYNPEDNIFGGTCYLRKLLGIFKGDLTLTLAAYNAGPTKVKELRRVPRIAETRRYVKKVLRNYKQYQAASSPHKRWVKVAYD